MCNLRAMDREIEAAKTAPKPAQKGKAPAPVERDIATPAVKAQPVKKAPQVTQATKTAKPAKTTAPSKAKTPATKARTSAKTPKAPKTTKKATKPKATPTVETDTLDLVSPAVVKLTDKEQRFVDEYLVDMNGRQAAIRAKYSPRSAAEIAHENLRKPHIQNAIAKARAEQQARTHITADRVLMEAWNVVTADARELTQLRIGCCRYCYGENHRYQRTYGERHEDLADWENKKDENKPPFDEKGGIGFDPLRDPVPTCPECAGEGMPRVVLMDTRNLSSSAKTLFAGVKRTRFGIEVQMHSKDAAMEKLFKHLGLYEKDNEQKTDPLKELLNSIAQTSGNAFMPVKHDHEYDTKPAGTGSAFTPIADPGEDD